MNLRDERQKEFAAKWLEKKKGILYLCPRFGKIRTSIYIMEKMNNPKTLIIYPIETIKKSWDEDLIKWNYNPDNITYCTTASLWKLAENPDIYDLIIVDECHLLSPANLLELKAIMDAGNKTVLGLSGTISDKTENDLNNVLGLYVVATYDIETAIQEKVVTDYQITVVMTSLDNTDRYIQPSKRVPNFRITEAQRYKWLTDKMEELKAIYNKKRAIWEAKCLSATKPEEIVALEKAKPDLGDDYGLLPIQRMQIFKKSLAKLQATQKLLARAQANNQRVLVFCGTTDVADKLGIPVFHSKAKDIEVRDAFCRGEGNALSTVDMFEAGVTVKPINVTIINSFDSNPENLAQRISRITGFEYDNPSKVAKIYIVCTDTIEKTWLTKALEFFDLSKVTYINS